jgi:hypothetical protein
MAETAGTFRFVEVCPDQTISIAILGREVNKNYAGDGQNRPDDGRVISRYSSAGHFFFSQGMAF